MMSVAVEASAAMAAKQTMDRRMAAASMAEKMFRRENQQRSGEEDEGLKTQTGGGRYETAPPGCGREETAVTQSISEAEVDDGEEGDDGVRDDVDQAELDTDHEAGVVDEADLEAVHFQRGIDEADLDA